MLQRNDALALGEAVSTPPAESERRTPIVELRSACKRFHTPEGGQVLALDQVSLAVSRNEFMTLLGPSGCGKTTLLRTISGFEDLDDGVILIDGQEVSGIPPHRRPVNTVFQNYALFPHLSVGENVAYSLEVAGIAREERTRRTAEALELVGLQGMERRKPRQLSGGQQQRVALARAIISRPKLLLLDEPLSALDRNLRQSMQLELKTLQHELGISFVFVTHDQEEALTMSDRIVVLDGGRIQQVGTPIEVYDRPVNGFVARFLGESNLFPARVEAVEGPRASVRSVFTRPLATVSGDLTVGKAVEILVRPEHLHLVSGTAPDEITVEGRLRQAVFVGSDYQLLVALEDGTVVKAMVRDIDRGLVSRLEPGSAVTLAFAAEVAHVIGRAE